jgi:hypothetical protein
MIYHRPKFGEEFCADHFAIRAPAAVPASFGKLAEIVSTGERKYVIWASAK